MINKALYKVGLTSAETKAYLELLKRGTASVTELAEGSGVHRTNIYSILDKLKGMGLVSEFSEDKKKKFKASDPKNVLNYLKEAQEEIKNALPELSKIRKSVKEKVSVELFRGKKGIQSAFNDIIRERKEVIGFGISGYLRKLMPIYAKQWLRDIQHYRIHNKYIYAEGVNIDHPYIETKTVSKEFITPVHTQIYANKVLITIWEPEMIAILITSKQVANNYRKHFALLWRIAKK